MWVTIAVVLVLVAAVLYVAVEFERRRNRTSRIDQKGPPRHYTERDPRAVPEAAAQPGD